MKDISQKAAKEISFQKRYLFWVVIPYKYKTGWKFLIKIGKLSNMSKSGKLKKVYDKGEYVSAVSGLPRPNIIKQTNIVEYKR